MSRYTGPERMPYMAISADTSFMVEVMTTQGGDWAGNGLRFATEAEAEDYARDLASRWTIVTEWRVVQTSDPANQGGQS